MDSIEEPNDESAEVEQTIRACAKIAGCDEELALAVARVESSWNKFATRFESEWRYFYQAARFANILVTTVQTEMIHQQTSWGLMQIMGSVARELGYVGHLPALCDANLGALMGCIKLASIGKRYEKMTDVIAAYNAGSPVHNIKGGYQNQVYVDRVMIEYMKLTGKA